MLSKHWRPSRPVTRSRHTAKAAVFRISRPNSKIDGEALIDLTSLEIGIEFSVISRHLGLLSSQQGAPEGEWVWSIMVGVVSSLDCCCFYSHLLGN